MGASAEDIDSGMGGMGGMGGMRFPGGGGANIDPNEIFKMFFGGEMGGMGGMPAGFSFGGMPGQQRGGR